MSKGPKAGHVVITNPDMLTLQSFTSKWFLFENLQFVVSMSCTYRVALAVMLP
jgi:hypothetical protein